MGKSWARAWGCCRKGDPFQGPRVRSRLTLRNELSEETRDFIGEGCPGRKQKGGEPQRTALPRGSQFYDDGISFWVVFGQSS